MTCRIPRLSLADVFPDKTPRIVSHFSVAAQEHVLKQRYLVEKGSIVLAFLFEGLPGVGAALFGDAPRAARRAERLPF